MAAVKRGMEGQGEMILLFLDPLSYGGELTVGQVFLPPLIWLTLAAAE